MMEISNNQNDDLDTVKGEFATLTIVKISFGNSQ